MATEVVLTYLGRLFINQLWSSLASDSSDFVAHSVDSAIAAAQATPTVPTRECGQQRHLWTLEKSDRLFADAKYFFNAYLCSCKCLIYNILQSFTEGHKFVRGDKLGTAFLQRN